MSDIYTPSQEEIEFSWKVTHSENANFCSLIMLRSFQRLGLFCIFGKYSTDYNTSYL